MGRNVVIVRNIHRKMLYRTFHAKIDEFIEKVPPGKIVNRFSRDVDVCDRM